MTGFDFLVSTLKPCELLTFSCLGYFCLDTVNAEIYCKIFGRKTRKRGSGLKENCGQGDIWIEMRFKSEDMGLLPSFIFIQELVLVNKWADCLLYTQQAL